MSICGEKKVLALSIWISPSTSYYFNIMIIHLAVWIHDSCPVALSVTFISAKVNMSNSQVFTDNDQQN